MSSPFKLPSSLHPVPGSPGTFIYQPFFAPHHHPPQPSPVDARFRVLDEAIWERWAVSDEGLVCETDPLRQPISIDPEPLNETLHSAANVEAFAWKELWRSGSPCGIMDRTAAGNADRLVLYQKIMLRGHNFDLINAREMIGPKVGATLLVHRFRVPSGAADQKMAMNLALAESHLFQRLNGSSQCPSIISPPSATLIHGYPLNYQGILIHEETALGVLPEEKSPVLWKHAVLLPVFRQIAAAACHLCRANFFLLSLSPNRFIVKRSGGVSLFSLAGGRTLDAPSFPEPLMRQNPVGDFMQGTIPVSDLRDLTGIIADESLAPQEKRERYVSILSKTNAFVLGTTFLRLILQNEYTSFISAVRGEEAGFSFCPDSYKGKVFVQSLIGNWQNRLRQLEVPEEILWLLQCLLADEWQTRISLEETLTHLGDII